MKVQGMIHPNLYFCIQSLAVIAHILKSILGHVKVKQVQLIHHSYESLSVLILLINSYQVLVMVSTPTAPFLDSIYNNPLDISGITIKSLEELSLLLHQP